MTDLYAMKITQAAVTTTNAQTWIKNNLIPLLLLAIVLAIFMNARKKDHKGSVTMVGIVIIGLFLLGLTITGKYTSLATWVSGLFVS